MRPSLFGKQANIVSVYFTDNTIFFLPNSVSFPFQNANKPRNPLSREIVMNGLVPFF